VKSSNYAQGTDGQLELLNYHFFSEIFLQPGGRLTSATLTRADAPHELMEYASRGDNYYFEGGHFDSERTNLLRFIELALARCVQVTESRLRSRCGASWQSARLQVS